jgi:hypothetical protein
MTTIAHVLGGSWENVLESMERYVGYSFLSGQTRYKIIGVYPHPLHELGQPFFPLTNFYEMILGYTLTYVNLPVFLAVEGEATHLDLDDPSFLNLFLINGGVLLPPEICSLSSGTLLTLL